MGIEFTGFSLTDVYAKTNPHKIQQKYGAELIITVNFAMRDGQLELSRRKVSKNAEYKAPAHNEEEEA